MENKDYLLITEDGYEVKEDDNVSWVISDFYNYELTLCKNHKELIENSEGIYKIFKDKRNALEYHNKMLLRGNCKLTIETLQEKVIRLENELNEVKQKIEEGNKPKVGDWCYFYDISNVESKVIGKLSARTTSCYTGDFNFDQCEKITNQYLIKLLEQEIK